jgi:hypothetical protein
MSKRSLAITALVLGVLLFLVSLAADPLGLGASPGLGWYQIAGAVVGVALAAYGMARLRGD